MLYKVVLSIIIIVDLSIRNWPVTGTYTGITYSNMYCAICNGALDPVTDELPINGFLLSKALNFWNVNIVCTNGTADLIEDDTIEINSASLHKLMMKK